MFYTSKFNRFVDIMLTAEKFIQSKSIISGAGFSLRNDINLKFAIFAEEIIRYSREGVDLMIKHGWFEQPPHMNDHS